MTLQKKMPIADFSKYLQSLMKPELYKDYCPNGMIVEASTQVHRVVTGVSFSMDLLEEAVSRKADAVIVHHPHGFWNNQPKLPIGSMARKMKMLFDQGVSLWGYHLPLDGHPEVGNNIGIARALGAEPMMGFMREGQADVGFLCKFREPQSVLELTSKIQQVFGSSGVVHSLMYGKALSSTIAVCSGGGATGIDEALRLGAEVYLTGEIKESNPIQASEDGFHLIACGHHATETFGPRLLAERISKDLGLHCEFVNIPNPV